MIIQCCSFNLNILLLRAVSKPFYGDYTYSFIYDTFSNKFGFLLNPQNWGVLSMIATTKYFINMSVLFLKLTLINIKNYKCMNVILMYISISFECVWCFFPDNFLLFNRPVHFFFMFNDSSNNTYGIPICMEICFWLQI